MIRTHNLGHVALGKELSITNGTPYEVRGYILEREAQDKERRKAYRTRNKTRPGRKGDSFTEYTPKPHPLYN